MQTLKNEEELISAIRHVGTELTKIRELLDEHNDIISQDNIEEDTNTEADIEGEEDTETPDTEA